MTDSEYDDGDDDVVEGESGDSGESESNANDSLYVPTPIRHNKARPIDFPNKLGFIALPQLGKFVETLNGMEELSHNPWLQGKFSSHSCEQPRVGWQPLHYILL